MSRPLLLLALLSLLLASLAAGQPAPPVSLWPQPTSVYYGDVALEVDPATFRIVASPQNGPSAILSRAIARYHSTLFSAALPVDDAEGGNSSASSSAARGGKRGALVALNTLEIRVLSTDENLRYGIDESYNLTVSAGSTAAIYAPTVFGAIYALETFTQLVVRPRSGNVGYLLPGAPWVIVDRPRFAWRGILHDTARHYYPVDFILHTIEALAANKMNVFHWHVIDADSFPIVSRVYPELSAKGAYVPDAVYTPEDVQMIILYAKDRGVRVVIEFDIPGHSSFGYAFPEIVGCPSYYDHPYVYEKQSVALDPTLDRTYEVLGNLLREMEQVFPDAYMHLGGDEVRHKCWETKPSIKAFMDANNIPTYLDLERYFWDRLGKEVLSTLSKTIVVWDDGFVNEVPIPETALIHVWQTNDYMIRAIEAGRQVIRSNGWYLDQAVPGGYRYRWLETWIDFYVLEPVPAGLTPAQEALVIGGQACMWTEQVDHNTFDAIVWPRASATAERLWSPKNINNSTEAGYRLMDHRCRLHMRNVNASPIFPDFCERDIGIERKGPAQEEVPQPPVAEVRPADLVKPHIMPKELITPHVMKTEGGLFAQPAYFAMSLGIVIGAGIMVSGFILVRAGRRWLKK